jgi:hypothetical protein
LETVTGRVAVAVAPVPSVTRSVSVWLPLPIFVVSHVIHNVVRVSDWDVMSVLSTRRVNVLAWPHVLDPVIVEHVHERVHRRHWRLAVVVVEVEVDGQVVEPIRRRSE